jgi:uncharacterized protein (TIGR00369 family)
MDDPLAEYPALREMQAVRLFANVGYRFTGAGEGWSEITLEVNEDNVNLYGILHGGAWLVVADSAMGGALGTLCAADERVITAQSEFRWLRPLSGTILVARARVLRRGRTLSHCTVELFDANGTQVGLGNGTYVILPPEANATG